MTQTLQKKKKKNNDPQSCKTWDHLSALLPPSGPARGFFLLNGSFSCCQRGGAPGAREALTDTARVKPRDCGVSPRFPAGGGSFSRSGFGIPSNRRLQWTEEASCDRDLYFCAKHLTTRTARCQISSNRTVFGNPDKRTPRDFVYEREPTWNRPDAIPLTLVRGLTWASRL